MSKFSLLAVVALVLLLSSFVYIPDTTNAARSSSAPNLKEINFIENSWKLAMRKAKAEHKLIFVDAYAVWCGPCKLLKSTTFRDPIAADFFNKNFVNLSIDMEKGEGIALSERWNIDSYPTLMVFDEEGRLVLQSTGFLQAKELVELGKQALSKQRKGT